MVFAKVLRHFGFFQSKQEQTEQQARLIYNAIVVQSRKTDFYTRLGVPDTLDGRFEMILLHAFLVIYHMRKFGEKGEALNQAIFDEMFANLDLSQREAGIGDMGVPHHIKRMMKAFYGRSVAYQQALESKGKTVLPLALKRNLYATHKKVTDTQLKEMADYLQSQNKYMAKLTFDFMTTDGVLFQPLQSKKPTKKKI